jgi:hypothetical protein
MVVGGFKTARLPVKMTKFTAVSGSSNFLLTITQNTLETMMNAHFLGCNLVMEFADACQPQTNSQENHERLPCQPELESGEKNGMSFKSCILFSFDGDMVVVIYLQIFLLPPFLSQQHPNSTPTPQQHPNNTLIIYQ